MIDIENLVFDTVYTQLASVITDISVNVTAGYDENEAVFPTLIVRETGNLDYQKTATEACSENHARVTYELEVWSDKQSTGRSECKRILNAADDIMKGMNFRRIYKSRPFNIDRTRWRQYSRYDAIVEKGQQRTVTVDGQQVVNTVFQIYRR